MIEFYGGYQVYSESGVDLTLLRENLRRSLETRWENSRMSAVVAWTFTEFFRSARGLPSRPEQEASTLPLQKAADGSYSALGANLSLIGDWMVTAVVEQGSRPVEVPFQVTCRPSPEQLQQMTMGRMPMVTASFQLLITRRR